jgi:hypothetical protein
LKVLTNIGNVLQKTFREMKMTKFLRKNVISPKNSELSRKNVPHFVILPFFLFYEFLVLIKFRYH